MYRIFLTSTLLTLIFSESLSAPLDPQCDLYQEVELGQEYFIFNQEYPRNYSSSRACRWIGQSPLGTVLVLTCNDFTLPYTRNCNGDTLAFSPAGDDNLNNAERYCGKTAFSAVTYANRIAIGLLPADNSVGGSFVCSLAAMRVGPQNCNCGYRREMRIVGGQETGDHEFPFMAGLIDVSKEEVFCGASVIAKRHAITAAHCLHEQTAGNLQLLVGAHDLNDPSAPSNSLAVVHNIASFTRHPSYVGAPNHHNDIGVLRTQTEIIFNVAVAPVCLPFIYREYNFEGETVTALGWGFTDLAGDKASTLQKVNLGVVSNRQCDAELAEDIKATQLCTYANGKDACISDSGGPLSWQDGYSGKLELTGIISFGLGCATTKPGVNTRVTAFLAWIASVTSDAEFCIK